MRSRFISLLTVFSFAALLPAQQAYINHNLTVRVQPQAHSLQVTDSLSIPAELAKPKMTFLLNNTLRVQVLSAGVTLKEVKKGVKAQDSGMDMEAPDVAARIRQNKYRLTFKNPAKGPRPLVLQYSGTIYKPVKETSEEYARSFSQTPGIISEKGIFLGGSSDWIPWFSNGLVTFRLKARLPAKWDVVSQGMRTRHQIQNEKRHVEWLCNKPMEEIFFIGAPFTEYQRQAGNVNVMAFLRTPDEALANKYLEITAQYLEMDRQLIGPYPFSKFALVENFWETGYGMPSFTLLGPQIIRFPFILHSSYPHELLHNWWGNSVYVNFNSGNWCEGLTVYLADHLIKEQRGQGANYRRSTLQKYTDYVNASNDFPLSKFLSRNSAATEAVGYGKCMMVWDMLREKIGDADFVKMLQTFYRQNKFKRASFKDIRKATEQVTGRNFKAFFRQWIQRKGAPQLQLLNVSVQKEQNGYALHFTLKQIQPEAPFVLDIPVAVSFAKKTVIKKVHLAKREQKFDLPFADYPLLLRIDPQFHVFRRLHYNEIPPSLSKIFGAQKLLIVLPSRAAEAQKTLYQQLANIWAKDAPKKIEIQSDDQISALPADRPVWLFGADNRFRPLIEKGLKDYDAQITVKGLRIKKTFIQNQNHSFIVSVRHPANPSSVIVWLTVGNSKAVPGLARKLPHYGKYSYLAFEGAEPTNMAKGQWPAVHSPMEVTITPPAGSTVTTITATLPKRKALAYLAPVFSQKRMMQAIRYLASDELQGRGLGTPGIEKAAQFIAENFKEAGLIPGGDNGSYFQTWQDVVDAAGHKGPLKNVIGILPGTNPKMAGESVVVSAHYDHLGLGWPDVHKGDQGKIHHGADDNASGDAVLMELAHIMGKSYKPPRTIIFVAFSGEENGLRGSHYFVHHTGKKYPLKKIIADLNLDTVGRLGNKKLLVLNSSTAKEWRYIFMGIGYVTGVESEMVPQQLDASDQGSFIAAGIPAVQIFSGAHRDYHRPTDTADKIDAAGLVKVATFSREALQYLAEREEPLTVTIKPGSFTAKRHSSKSVRRVTTGAMPDFTFAGSGVRLAEVPKDTPAGKAGLQKNDIIIQFGKFKVHNLRQYAEAMKKFNPGDTVPVRFLRAQKERETKVTLKER